MRSYLAGDRGDLRHGGGGLFFAVGRHPRGLGCCLAGCGWLGVCWGDAVQMWELVRLAGTRRLLGGMALGIDRRDGGGVRRGAEGFFVFVKVD